MREHPSRAGGSTLKFVPVAIFALVAGLFLVALRSGEPSKLPSALLSKPVPNFAFPAVPGLEALPAAAQTIPGVTPALFKPGDVTVVNFWASWCAPCVEEHPQLVQLKAAGITVAGINVRDDPAAARQFLGRHGNPYAAIGADPNGRGSIEWGVYGTPETFVVDAAGRIAMKLVGPVSPADLKDKVLPAIERAKAAKK